MIYTIVRKDDSNNIDAVISFSSISSMEESWSSTVTNQVVEYGYNITDNINIEAPTYTISAVLSSYSLFDTGKEIVWSDDSFKTNESTVDKNSHVKARDEIIKIFSDRRMVTLLESEVDSSNKDLTQKESELKAGHFKETDSCIITSLTISHPSEGYGAFFVNITLQKIVTAMITLAELEEGEKIPMLKQLAITYEPAKTTKDEKEGLTDPSTGEPIEETITEKSGNYDEMNKKNRAALGIDSDIDYNKKVAEARYMQQQTGETYTVGKRGDAYIVVKGQSNLFRGIKKDD